MELTTDPVAVSVRSPPGEKACSERPHHHRAQGRKAAFLDPSRHCVVPFGPD